ncbi:VOC family protein [Sphingomonas sp. JC676]|uniref:VOC family protein n=1 Tax=Sphingomonas sp. JC676 TaxID=2768065 RepID=UPI001657F1B5|nr:VOC family protein [Sphingomonas sp. JC676]MBC9031093.1 VOC family protein [Sphingomonas sp. JC676]
MHIPPGFTTLFPYFFVDGARAYLDFLADGLGGEIAGVHASPDGIVRNAQVRFGDTTIMVSEAGEGREATRGTYYLYVANADAAMARGVAAGGTQLGEIGDRDYGDRQGGLADPAGNIWWLSQRLSPGPY